MSANIWNPLKTTWPRSWNTPGPANVRQLKNIAERYVLGVGPTRTVRALLGGPESSESSAPTSLTERVQRYEAQLIMQALKQHKGNIAEVMRSLDLPRRTLNNKMIQYGIKRKDFMDS